MFRQIMGLTAAIGLLVSASWAMAEDAKIWTVDQAAQEVGKQGTVELQVKSSRLLESGKFCFLNSEKDFQEKSNFTIAISAKALEKFKASGVDDPATHFRDKTVQVTGKVAVFKERPQIQVDDPKQIVLIERLVVPKKK